MKRLIPSILTAALLLLAPTARALAAPTAAQRCEDRKLRAAAKYVSCRLVADAVHASRGDSAKRDAAYAKCAEKLSTAWSKAESQSSGACPTAGDLASVETYLESASAKARDWTGGDLAGPLVFERHSASGQAQCWAGGTGISAPLPASCAGTGQDGDVAAGAPLAFVDAGDGTIVDANTGLQWEKKSDDGSLHDKDLELQWSGTCSDTSTGEHLCSRDADCVAHGGTCQGATVFEWLDELNASGFAGHSDWRLPNVRELGTIVDYGRVYPAVPSEFEASCGVLSQGNPGCDVTGCSCTDYNAAYWSSSTLALSIADGSRNAWQVYFLYGYQVYADKTETGHVRAVRGGS